MSDPARTFIESLADIFRRAAEANQAIDLNIDLYGVVTMALVGVGRELDRLQADRDRVTAAYAAAVEECNRAVVTCNEALAVARQVVAVQEFAAASVTLPPGVVRLRAPQARVVPIRVPEGGQPA